MRTHFLGVTVRLPTFQHPFSSLSKLFNYKSRLKSSVQYDFYQCFVVPYFGNTSLDDYFRVFLNTILSIILNILLHILFYSPPIFHYARTTQPVSLYVAGLPIHFIIHGSGSNFRIHVSGS